MSDTNNHFAPNMLTTQNDRYNQKLFTIDKAVADLNLNNNE